MHPGTTPSRIQALDNLTIISANVRGFQTNVGDLTHSHVLQHSPDIIATTETFLNSTVPDNFGQISGYSRWLRRDRVRGTFGGVAVCFRNGFPVQALTPDLPDHLEMMFFRLWTRSQDSILLCVCYRPQWQGGEPLNYLTTNMDALLLQHSCKHLVIVGDLNQHLVQRQFDELLTVFGLTNHVDFPTHISGSSLDPVITDLPNSMVTCRPLATVGSSDHLAVLTKIKLAIDRDEGVTRTNWLWDKGDWEAIKIALDNTVWSDVLVGDVNTQVQNLSDILLSCQGRFVPSQTYKSKSGDQPWFGFQCRRAADKKSKAWLRCKSHPNRRNQRLHKEACKNMKRVQNEAINSWKYHLMRKLTGQSVGNKDWWSSIKQQQGFSPDDSIPPLTTSDGSIVTRDQKKAQVLAAHFSSKMSVPDPGRATAVVPVLTKATLDNLTITKEEVYKELQQVDTKKALGPDCISPHILKKCATQLAVPLAIIFQRCLSSQQWPSQWKVARVCAIHKKKSRADPQNYRPISLLSVLGKAFESIIAAKMSKFFDSHHLLNSRQFGFRQGRSAADLLLLQSAAWNHSLDRGEDTFVVALDIAGAFDRVWHQGITTKLKSLGICGDLLHLLQDYLHGRTLRVVVNGHTSTELPVKASVPQGSVLGPLLWNVYFNDILQLIPEATAYADDCTLTFTCERSERRNTVTRINQALQSISSWGRRWQVTFAPEKTQAMLISRRQDVANREQLHIQMEGRRIHLQESVSILGVEFDSGLTFTSHVRKVAKNAAWKLSCVRRISHLLDSKGVVTLYNSQVRSLMEYSPLAWSSCPQSYLGLLDRVQARAQRLARLKAPAGAAYNCQPLQQRRDVAGLCVMYKVHRMQLPQLAGLRLDSPAPTLHATRAAHNTDHQVIVPFARTEYYLRSFLPRYSRLWNTLVRQTDMYLTMSLQVFKTNVNNWLQGQPHL